MRAQALNSQKTVCGIKRKKKYLKLATAKLKILKNVWSTS